MEARLRSGEMKVPSRPAPTRPNQNNNYSSDLFSTLRDPFSVQSTNEMNAFNSKKKPPPRPPPPKGKGHNKGSSQFFEIFGRNKEPSRSKAAATAIVKPMPPVAGVNVAVESLIDLSSPPDSPTFTKSSSNYSIQSMGSNRVSRLKSPVESGFEDDFGSVLASNASSPTSDFFSDSDPFSPVSCTSNKSSFSQFHELSNDDPKLKIPKGVISNGVTRPTIIRALNRNKPSRPPPPKKLQETTLQTSIVGSGSFVTTFTGPVKPTFSDENIGWASPPMPKVPPPPPPPEAIQEIFNGPQIPPRPSSLLHQEGSSGKTPFCKAEYDYQSGHPDDLSFKVGDVITIVGRLNNEWLKGVVHGKEGTFPENHVQIIVPLEEQNDLNMTVIALYPFNAETWDDLDFEEGDEIRVLRRINDDWLYGECNGRQGQFPECFVRDITSFIGES